MLNFIIMFLCHKTYYLSVDALHLSPEKAFYTLLEQQYYSVGLVLDNVKSECGCRVGKAGCGGEIQGIDGHKLP